MWMAKRAGYREAGRKNTSGCHSVIYLQELLWTVKRNSKQGHLDHDHYDVDASEYLVNSLWPALPVSGVTAKGHSCINP